MDLETTTTTTTTTTSNDAKEPKVQIVKELQAVLFPPAPKTTGTSFFANFMIKPGSPFDDYNDDDDENNKKRDPPIRELYSICRDSNFAPQAPRWPTECQVLDDRVKHISYVPPTPEPYYVPTGKEPQPKPTGDETGVIVYQYSPISAVNYFSRSSVGGSRYLMPASLVPEEDSLRFESRFESGNLGRAIRITPSYYELHLRNDLYTNRHTQWFYFKVTNMKKNFLYRFSIVNFSKEDSLFNEGMRPLMYSTKDSQLHSVGWKRCGDNVTYYSNDNVIPEDPDSQMSYTLSFTMEFPHEEDEVYIAHCYPYTYSDLEDYLTELSNHPVKAGFTTVRLLCKSLAGNNVHHVTITSQPIPGDTRKKRAVVVTARVHPGETPASWIMKGILDFLTSDCSAAKELRDKFIFKLVPMLNPDGVIVGNNRCSLSAKDLNRQYRTVMRDAYPSIWYTKLMVRRLLEECGVALYCDLHAHSRKHNIFVYGCESRRGTDRKLQEQVFPLMLHKNTADKFSFESCKFHIQKAKEGTGRVVMWMMGIANSYTMESSFAGSVLGTRAGTHFSTLDFEQMGKSFCQTLLDFYDDDPRKEKLRVKIINRLVKGGSNANEPTNIQLSDYSSDEGDTSSSSSNEVGRDDEETPMVPPPSPVIYKKPKPRSVHTATAHHKKKAAMASKTSPNLIRKPLPISKASLGLSLSEKYNTSESSSDSEELMVVKKPVRRKLRKKKTAVKKRDSQTINHHSDGEVDNKDQRSISVFDLIPNDKLKGQNLSTKRSKTPLSKTDRRNAITQQLSEVQAKLLILKNKLWYGTGDGNEPLSWGSGNSPAKTKKHNKKKQAVVVVNDKRAVPKSGKGDHHHHHHHVHHLHHQKPKKLQTGLRRQTAFEWSQHQSSSGGGANLKKAQSLPENVIPKMRRPTLHSFSCDEQETAFEVEKIKSKKKGAAGGGGAGGGKPRTKFVKKAKNVSNAKVFLLRKD